MHEFPESSELNLPERDTLIPAVREFTPPPFVRPRFET